MLVSRLGMNRPQWSNLFLFTVPGEYFSSWLRREFSGSLLACLQYKGVLVSRRRSLMWQGGIWYFYMLECNTTERDHLGLLQQDGLGCCPPTWAFSPLNLLLVLEQTQKWLRDHVTEFGGQDVPAFHLAISKNVYIANGPNKTSHLLSLSVRILLLIGNCWISVTWLLRKD